MECIPPLTAFDSGSAPSLSCSGISDPATENLPHGEACTLTCPSGFKVVDGSPALGCEKGILRGCLDSGCTELTDTLPLCVAADKTYNLVDAISTGIVATTVGANFLSAKEDLAAEKFAEALHTHVKVKSEQESTVSISALEITELAAAPADDGRRIQDGNTTAADQASPTLAPAKRTSKVYGPVLVVPASGVEEDGFGKVYDVIQLMATSDAAGAEFLTGLQAALLNSFPLVTVEAVVVDAPRMTKTWVEVPGAAAPAPTPAPTAAPEAAASGGYWLYIGLFIVLLAIAGGGAGYYFKVYLPQQQAQAAGEVDPLTGQPLTAPAGESGERSMV